MTEHSKLPWRKHDDGRHSLVITDPQSSKCICDLDLTTLSGFGPKQAEANAAFMVKACNNFDQLLGACRTVLHDLRAECGDGINHKYWISSGVLDVLTTAIKVAEKE